MVLAGEVERSCAAVQLPLYISDGVTDCGSMG